jgi:hypothetical protein
MADPESVTRPDRGAHSQANGMWAPVAQRQIKSKRRGAGARGMRFTALPVVPPKTLARSDLRAALRRREAPPLLHRIAAAISFSTSTTARLHLRHGQQWRLRLIDRRYAISLSVSLSVSPKHLHCLANHRAIQHLVDPLTLTMVSVGLTKCS